MRITSEMKNTLNTGTHLNQGILIGQIGNNLFTKYPGVLLRTLQKYDQQLRLPITAHQ